MLKTTYLKIEWYIVSLNRKKIIIAGGGTGGHLFPALAIGETLEKDGMQVKYIGSKNGIEATGNYIEKNKIELLDLYGISRSFTLNSFKKNILLILKVIKSYLKVKNTIDSFNPDLVIGTGGYSCAIPLYLAQKKNIHTAIQEQNVLPGLTTKKFSRKSTIVFTAFDESKKYLDNCNLFLSGNPIRKRIKEKDSVLAKKAYNLNPDKFTMLIVGGSQGARSINKHFQKNITKYIDKGIQIIWQTGNNSSDIIRDINDDNVLKFDFIDDIENAYAASDLVISRAGATAISEILFLKKPSILIPYPYASDNHQEINAKVLENSGAAVMIKENEFKSLSLEKKIFDLFESREALDNISLNTSKLSNPNASDVIKDKIKEIISC